MTMPRHAINIKSKDDIKVMIEGGKRLRDIKKRLFETVRAGISAYEIETLATELIKKTGGKPSFKMVSGYKWSTCVNVNAGLVHGIPKKDIVFAKGDLVSVDVGLFYKGFHTDTSFSKGIDLSTKNKKFFDCGRLALKKAISQAKKGKRIYDISSAIEEVVVSSGYVPVRALVGHGVGRELHEEPLIPCVRFGKRENSPEIVDGMTIAIEVMYVMGSEKLVQETDGWTISTSDGKISALFEETVAVTPDGPLVIT